MILLFSYFYEFLCFLLFTKVPLRGVKDFYNPFFSPFLKTPKKAKKGLFWGYPQKVQKWDKSGKKGPKTPFFCTLWSF